ncbi:MAG: DUF805 domain-containing protein [Asticcacaulis sp.]
MNIVNTLLSPYGRLSRIGLWGWGLSLALICLILWWVRTHYGAEIGLAGPETGTEQGLDPLWLALAIPLLWIGLCLMVKRWHDRGRSGWWLLIGLVPVIGQVWTLIECGFLAGQRTGNRFGPSPDGYRASLSPYRLEDMPEDMP